VSALLSDSIEWFNSLPSGTQQLVVLILGLALPAAGAALLLASNAILRTVRQTRRKRRLEQRKAAAAKIRLRQPADPTLGLWDHASKVHPAMARANAAIAAASDRLSTIDDLLGLRSAEIGALDDHVQKRRSLQRFAKELKPHVTELQSSTRSMAVGLKEMVDGYRVLFSEASISSHSEAAWLAAERAKFERMAAVFPTTIQSFIRRREVMNGVRGKERSLTVEADKYLQAVTEIIRSMELATDFCGDEMPNIVAQRLGWRWRLALLFRSGTKDSG
jgi:hypothetical protein